MHARLVSILALAVTLLYAMDATAQIRRVAVIVGANVGDHDEKPLRYAEQDARRMATVLRELGGVAEEDLVLLLGANADTVSLTMESMFERLRDADEETVLFVYYSGHADATAIHLGGTHLRLSSLRRTLEEAPADVKVLVLDACRSGEMTRVKGGVPAEPFELDSAQWEVGEGIAIITSAASGEDAQESDRIGGSFFTHHFVSGLLGAADVSSDGIVTLSEAYEYAYRETLRSTSRARFVQHPTYAFDIKGRRDLAITAPSQKFEGMGRLGLTGAGSYVVFRKDAAGQIIAEVRVERPTEIALAEGQYFVRRRHNGNVYEASADVIQSHRTAVEPRHMQRISTARVARKGGEESRRAWGVVTGGGYSGEVFQQTSGVPQAMLGVQLDMSLISLQLRGRFGRTTVDGDFLRTRHDLFGGDISALNLFDVGKAFVGGGLRVGGDYVRQSFPNDFDEADRKAMAGRGSALIVLGYAVTSWLSVFVEPSVDMYVLSLADDDSSEGRIGFRFAPVGTLGLGIYL